MNKVIKVAVRVKRSDDWTRLTATKGKPEEEQYRRYNIIMSSKLYKMRHVTALYCWRH